MAIEFEKTSNETTGPESDVGGRRRHATRIAALAAVLAVGIGGGAGAVIALDGSETSTGSAAVATQTAQPAASTTGTLSTEQIYARTAPGVVEITARSTSTADSAPFGPQSQTQEASGSGFVWDTSGHVVTNYHVVEGGSSYTVTFQDGSTAKATLVGSDPSTDLAVLKVSVSASKLTPLQLADSDLVKPGQAVVAIGSPFGLADTITAGIVSAVSREIESPNGAAIVGVIQTDAAINHGNSGGPLIDSDGKVIGVNSQIESDSGGNDGVGFAVPSNTVSRVVERLVAGQQVEHAFLGITPVTVTSSVADQLGLRAGVLVGSVQSGSAAGKAGLKAGSTTRTVDGTEYTTDGDVIVAIDGKSVTTADALRAAIDGYEPGDKITLTVVRGGEERSVTVTLGTRQSS